MSAPLDLRAALQEECAAQRQVQQVAQRLQVAQAELVRAREARMEMIAAAATGGVANPHEVAMAIADAEFNLAVITEASGVAAERLRAATDAVTAILVAMVQEKSQVARAKYEQACDDFDRAAKARNQTYSAMSSLQNAGAAVANAKMLVAARTTSPRPNSPLGNSLNQHLAELEIEAARRDVESAGDTLRRLCDAEITAASHA